MSQYVGYATIRENYSTSLIIAARSLGIEGILYRLFPLLLFFFLVSMIITRIYPNRASS